MNKKELVRCANCVFSFLIKDKESGKFVRHCEALCLRYGPVTFSVSNDDGCTFGITKEED